MAKKYVKVKSIEIPELDRILSNLREETKMHVNYQMEAADIQHQIDILEQHLHHTDLENDGKPVERADIAHKIMILQEEKTKCQEKLYALYLMGEFEKLWRKANPKEAEKFNSSPTYEKLYQFAKEGHITGILYRNADHSDVIDSLSLCREKISEYADHNRLNVKLNTYDIYQRSLHTPR
jgi:hypothetical protein